MDDLDNQRIRTEYSKRHKRQLLSIMPLLALVIPLIVLQNSGPGGIAGIPPSAVGPILFVVAGGVLIFSAVNWRCPACNRYLGRTINPKFCNYCGVQLRD